MSLTHATAVRNAIADAVVDLIDAGSSEAAGYLTLTTSGDSVLVTMPFANPAFGAASSGVATANSISNQTASGTGTAAKVKVYDRDDTLLFSGTVTATSGGGDVELDNTSIASGQTISISSATYTAPT